MDVRYKMIPANLFGPHHRKEPVGIERCRTRFHLWAVQYRQGLERTKSSDNYFLKAPQLRRGTNDSSSLISDGQNTDLHSNELRYNYCYCCYTWHTGYRNAEMNTVGFWLWQQYQKSTRPEFHLYDASHTSGASSKSWATFSFHDTKTTQTDANTEKTSRVKMRIMRQAIIILSSQEIRLFPARKDDIKASGSILRHCASKVIPEYITVLLVTLNMHEFISEML